jgi:hypothetical protein
MNKQNPTQPRPLLSSGIAAVEMANASLSLEPPSDQAVKKARRQTAFYPAVNSTNKQSKPFSRSAAKRESVLALGSIEHLQHYFTKTGLSAKSKYAQPPSVSSSLFADECRGRPAQALKGKGYVLAIGGHAKSSSVASSGIPEIRFELPPSPAVPIPPRKPFHEHIKSYETDPDELLPELVKDLEAVSDIWALGTSEQRIEQTAVAESNSAARVDSPPQAARAVMLSPLDILAVLKSTTTAVRSVRNYLVVLPEHHDYSSSSADAFRSPSLSPRNRPVPLPRQSSDTPLNIIRQVALEVLGVLRDIEEKYRLPITEEVSDVHSDHGSASTRSRVPSPGSDDSESVTSFTFSMVKPKGISREILVFSDDEDDINKEEPEEKRETWDEKLVLGGGWLYRQNVALLDLEKEREVVAYYLETVDKLMFGGETPLHQRGWAFALQRLRARQRRSANSEKLSPSLGEIRAGHVRGNRVVSNGLLDAMNAMVVSAESESQPPSPTSHESWDEDHLPDWAKVTCFVDDLLGEYITLWLRPLYSYCP